MHYTWASYQAWANQFIILQQNIKYNDVATAARPAFRLQSNRIYQLDCIDSLSASITAINSTLHCSPPRGLMPGLINLEEISAKSYHTRSILVVADSA